MHLQIWDACTQPADDGLRPGSRRAWHIVYVVIVGPCSLLATDAQTKGHVRFVHDVRYIRYMRAALLLSSSEDDLSLVVVTQPLQGPVSSAGPYVPMGPVRRIQGATELTSFLWGPRVMVLRFAAVT